MSYFSICQKRIGFEFPGLEKIAGLRAAALILCLALLPGSAIAGIPDQDVEPQLRVIIQPQDAVEAGAAWRLVGWGAWYDSGRTVEVPCGDLVVEFRDTDTGDWITPADFTITVSEGRVYSHTAVYNQPFGDLTVTIFPEEAREAGAYWQVDGAGPCYLSGETAHVTAGSHDIEFSPVRGLARPLMRLDVAAGSSINKSVAYLPLVVGRVRIKADNIILTGNMFKASGNVRLAFPGESSGPDTGIIGLTGSAFGTVNPPRIQSNGSVFIARDAYKIPIFGKVGFYTGNFTLNGLTLKASGPNHVPGAEFLGLDMEVRSFGFRLNPFGVSMNCYLDLDEELFGIGGRLDVRKLLLISGETIPLADYTILTDGYNLFDFMACEGVTCTGNAFTNTIDCHVDSIIIPYIPSIEGDLLIKDGTLKKLDALMVGADKQIKDTPFYLQDVTLKLRNVNTRQGSVRVGLAGTLLPKDCALAGADMDVDIDFTGYAEGTGSISVLGYKTSEGNFTLYVPSFVTGDFYHNVLFGLRKLTGNFTAFWSNGRLNSFWGSGRGTVGFSPPDWAVPLLGQLVADDGYVYVLDTFVHVETGGFRARVKLLNLISLGFYLPPDWISGEEGSGMRTLESSGLSRISVGGATAANAAFEVPAGSPGVVFSGVGGRGCPVLALVRPDGVRIDPAVSLPGNSRDFIYRSHPGTRSTAVLVREPLPGFWSVEVTNPGEAGETELVFYEGNHSPRIRPLELEKVADRNFRLRFKAFDPDDEAEVSFFLDENSWGFDGIPIGTCTENDGKTVFNWRPGDLPFASGYVYAVVDDGVNARETAYFEEKAFVKESSLSPPELTECVSRGNRLILRIDPPASRGVDHLRVYFTDDMEAAVIREWINVQAGGVIRIKGGAIKPGRRYRIAVSAVDTEGAETRLSGEKKVDYVAGSLNNHPFFTSRPETGAMAGEAYAYAFRAVDRDGDPLAFRLKDGPEEMTLDAGPNTLRWTPGQGDLGRNRVILTVEDGRGGEEDQTFFVQVDSEDNSSIQTAAEWVTGEDGRELFLRVVDHAADRDGSRAEGLEVSLADEYGAEYARVSLRETSARSGIFQGLFSPAETAGPLQALVSAGPGAPRGRELRLRWESGSPAGLRTGTAYLRYR